MQSMTRRRAMRGVLALSAGALLPSLSTASAGSHRVPVIYSSDLMHPHDDPDDHFDLACLYAMPEADVRAIILDNGGTQAQRPGLKPVWQLNYLTGRAVPSAIGLLRPLRHAEDKALDQPAEHQNGVNLLLQTLRDSREKVAIIFVGSARDTVAAFNREPELFRRKVRSIHGFIGEASDPEFIEYNVGLDPWAYVRLMRSELPFFWIPCFDGGLWQNKGHASFWKVRHGQVLGRAPEPLQRYFFYMLKEAKEDPIPFLSGHTSEVDRQAMMAGERNLWAGALLGLALGRSLREKGSEVVGFDAVRVAVTDRGTTRAGSSVEGKRVRRFVVRQPEAFARAATAATADLLGRFPLRAHLDPTGSERADRGARR